MGIGENMARHLLVRTGFGPRRAEILATSKRSASDAVDALIRSRRTVAATPDPTWAGEVPLLIKRRMEMRTATDKAAKQKIRRELNAVGASRGVELKGWWYAEMASTTSPITERMTLFWHNHFTSSLKAVKSPVLIHRQNATLREHALGNFGDLLRAMTRDPAMIVYLDNRTNRKRKPNENFARELLELFTLGEGHYTERDIKEAARAFTGWHIDRRTGGFRMNARQHDRGAKEFMGKKGALDGDDIVDALLENPRTAEYVTEKLWRALVSETPDSDEITRLAGVFRKANYEIAPLLKAMLTSSHFMDPEAVGSMIKSPVQLIVGTIRLFMITPDSPRVLTAAGRRLNQDLFDPPNVKGWPGGKEWITTDTLLARQNLLERLFRTPENIPELERRGWAALLGKGHEGNPVAALEKLMLPMSAVFGEPEGGGPFESARHFALDPAYQLM